MSGFHWVNWVPGQPIPPTAVYGGNDTDGATIYVGRAEHEHDFLPAKVIPERRVSYVCCSGREHIKDKVQILCEQRFHWIPDSNGHVPHGAVHGGIGSTGEKIYIGRAHHNVSLTVGKVHPSHGCLYIPYAGKEISIKNYEVLTLIE